MTSSASSSARVDAAIIPFFQTPAATPQPSSTAHADAHERHFCERVHERFHLKLSPQKYRYWIEKVEQVLPGTEFLYEGACTGRTVWKICSGSYVLHVVYDETTERLVTCFPSPFPQLPIKRLRRLRAQGRHVSGHRPAHDERCAAA